MSEPVFSLLPGRTLLVLSAVLAVAGVDLVQRYKGRKTHLLFSLFLGTVLSFGLMRMTSLIMMPSSIENPFIARYFSRASRSVRSLGSWVTGWVVIMVALPLALTSAKSRPTATVM